MTIIEKNKEKVYISKDGKKFDNKFLCLTHEDSLRFEEMKSDLHFEVDKKSSHLFFLDNEDDFNFLIDYIESEGYYNTKNHLYKKNTKWYFLNLYEKNADFEIRPIEELIKKTEKEVEKHNKLLRDLHRYNDGYKKNQLKN